MATITQHQCALCGRVHRRILYDPDLGQVDPHGLGGGGGQLDAEGAGEVVYSRVVRVRYAEDVACRRL